MRASNLKSYAKINIGLRIINKREDNFHNIETIFYPVNLYDEIEISLKPATKDCNTVLITVDKYYVPADKSNVCYKMIESFFKHFNITDCYRIELLIRKNIPVSGGMGGGSSDAATVLKYLIKYFNVNIKEHREDILKIALSVGSDVPFFLVNKPCLATGRGEKLIILPEFKIDYRILLVNPNVSVSTKWAYENYKLSNYEFKKTELTYVKTFDLSEKNIYINDFESVVFGRYKELGEIKKYLLNNGAVFSSLSGSGATMYGFFPHTYRNNLSKCYRHFSSKGYFVRIV